MPGTVATNSATARAVATLRLGLTFNNLKSSLLYYVLVVHLLKAYRHVVARGPLQTFNEARLAILRSAFSLMFKLPSIKSKVDSEMAKARLDIENKMVPSGPSVTRHLALPKMGHTPEWIKEEMDRMDREANSDCDWKQGKLSGAVYHGGEDLEKVITAAIAKYLVSNPLHPDVFPAVRKMDAEIVAMCLRMYVPSLSFMPA
ncbi:hypothetical protein DL93DRAFT_1201412 [Clavulina sp. PMI_390]|nr:hypothetical protein DL93DRAFT_1201412 [Clavulina sp. PMI_390]